MERKGPFRKLWTMLIGNSRATRRVRRQIRQVAPSNAPVLIRGQQGTGKNLIARLIHDMSNRGDRPFITLRCDEVAVDILERTLFGYARGAFPGARNAGKGWLEKAHGGSIFLDEIAALAPSTQVKLLRLLQERVFEPVGSTTPIPVDIRLLAATQHPLEQRVRSGTFRGDLFYRLTVFPIQVQPLRKHKADIPALVDRFIARNARARGKTVPVVSPEAMDLLKHYRWPGNVRELEACIAQAIRKSTDGWVHGDHLSLA